MDEPRKRSRFDMGAPPAASRSDRRSRSPEARVNRDRSRSPIKSSGTNGNNDEDEKASSAAARAAEKAAAISAALQARKGVQHVDVPPIRTAAPAASSEPKSPTSNALKVEIYQQDGDFIKDIEINDLRNRYTLTRGTTQKMIKEKTGADVTTRGEYYPDKAMATAASPPLFLHITSTTKDKLEAAVELIKELMAQELPNLIDERRFRGSRRDQPEGQEQEQRPRQPRKYPEERIPVDLEPIRGFNLRAQVVGHGGQYVKHIQSETRCRVQIKGRGSGFIESDTGAESDEPMFLHVSGAEQEMVDHAKELCVSLLESVTAEYNNHKARMQQNYSNGPGSSSYGDRNNYNNRGGGNDRHNSSPYGGAPGRTYDQNSYNSPTTNPYATAGYTNPYAAQTDYSSTAAVAGSTAGAAAVDPAEQAKQYEAWITYYAQNPDQDPYKEYGGYAAMVASYSQQAAGAAAYGQQPQQQGYAGSPANGGAGGVPPPPPPPDAGSGYGGGGAYSAVPPPPGV